MKLIALAAVVVALAAPLAAGSELLSMAQVAEAAAGTAPCGGDPSAPCCDAKLCPLVGGVCCPGTTTCCGTGGRCLPRALGAKQMCGMPLAPPCGSSGGSGGSLQPGGCSSPPKPAAASVPGVAHLTRTKVLYSDALTGTLDGKGRCPCPPGPSCPCKQESFGFANSPNRPIDAAATQDVPPAAGKKKEAK